MQVHIVEVSSVDSEQRHRWLHLFDQCETARFYLHPHWLQCVSDHLSPAPLHIAFVQHDNELCLVMPLCQSQGNSRRRHPGHDHLSLNDILIHPQFTADTQRLFHAIDLVLTAAGTGWWDWQISNVPHHSILMRTLLSEEHDKFGEPDDIALDTRFNLIDQSELSANKWRLHLSRRSASFDCTSDACPPHAKLKRNLRRLRKQIETDAVLRVEQVSDREELETAYESFLQTESSGWKGNNQQATAITANSDLTNFYRALLFPETKNIEPVINLLWRDDECCAAQFGLRTGKCLSLLKIGYNEAYARFSPGYLLLESVLESAKENGIETLSLVTSPPWAERWHPQSEPVWQITHYNGTSFGTALHRFDQIKDAARSRLRTAA